MIIDFHTHIFSPEVKNNRSYFLRKDSSFETLYSRADSKIITADDLINVMDEKMINCSVVMGIGWNELDSAKASNDYIIESCQKYKDRLIGLGSVNPVLGDDALNELNRCLDSGLVGMGEIHPDLQQFNLDDFNVMNQFMTELKLKNGLLLTHSSEPVGHLYTGKGFTTPDKIWRFLNMFPDSNVVLAHWGGGLPFYSLMPEVSEAISNFYFDTAASPYLYSKSIFDIANQLIGPERILFGSDYPLISQSRIINQIKDSRLLAEEQQKIFSDNAIRLLAKLKGGDDTRIYEFQ